LLLSRTARAECKAPFIGLDWDSTISAGDRLRIASELRADLEDQSIGVCDDPKAGAPAARIVISEANGGVSIRLEVKDAITSKEVARSIDTSSIPPDGRALAIALAAAELLRASWAELTLRDAPPTPVPAPVRRIVERSLREPAHAEAPRIVGLGVAFATEAFTSGFVRFGADVRGSVDLGSRLSFGLSAGFRRALSRTGPDGQVDAEALLFSADGAYALFPRTRRYGLEPFVRFIVVPIAFHAAPTGGAATTTATLVGIETAGGLRGRFSLTRNLALVAEVGGGAALRSADAKDGDVVVATTSGGFVLGSLGVRGLF
jgi:hypothetical protein